MRAFTGARGPGRAMGGGERPFVVQKHFHAFHAFIHPAWPDGCRATPFFFTGSRVAGEPGSEGRDRERLGMRPSGCPPYRGGEPDYRRIALR